MEFIGYVGGLCFAICAIPEVYASYKRGYSNMDPYFLGLWFTGEVLTLAYVWPTALWPLIMNYTVNLICLVYIIYLKYRSYRLKSKMWKWFEEEEEDLFS